MKVRYDAETDILTVIFRDVAVAESDEGKPGVVMDYDSEGNLIAVEVLEASLRVEEPESASTSPIPATSCYAPGVGISCGAGGQSAGSPRP